jgi:glycosyltransferase involved in cell wall biosynthesis
MIPAEHVEDASRLTVSTIVPVYNAARYLRATLESAVAQTLPPLEIIVVDDGSTDESAVVARGFREVRCLQQPNQGCAAARNRGVAAARGDLLAFLDADDLWTADKLAVQVAYMTAHPEVGYTLARQELFLEAGARRPPAIRPEHLEHDQVGYLPSTLVVRRPVFDRIGGFDITQKISSDVDWFLRAKDLDVPMAVLPQVLVRRRIHDANLSTDTRANQAALLKVFKASIDRQRARGPQT